MKVAVFGASVSAQTVHHTTKEVTGYSEVLRRRWMQALGASELKQICYAGGRLSDGGLYRVGHVLGYQPELCLVEPLAEDVTRGRSLVEGEALFMYGSMLSRGILPFVVLLPEPVKRTARKWDTYALHVALCKRLGLPTVDIDISALERLDDYFIGLHTRLRGAELYAEAIARGVAALGDRRELVKHAHAAAMALPARLRQVVVETPTVTKIQQLVLRITPHRPGAYRFRVVQAQRVGPFSPVLAIAASGQASSGEEIRSVWDPFCHYEREAYPVLDDRSVEAPGGPCTIGVVVSEIDPPYSDARHRVERWPAPAERALRPIGPIKVFSTLPVDVELLRYQ